MIRNITYARILQTSLAAVLVCVSSIPCYGQFGCTIGNQVQVTPADKTSAITTIATFLCALMDGSVQDSTKLQNLATSALAAAQKLYPSGYTTRHTDQYWLFMLSQDEYTTLVQYLVCVVGSELSHLKGVKFDTTALANNLKNKFKGSSSVEITKQVNTVASDTNNLYSLWQQTPFTQYYYAYTMAPYLSKLELLLTKIMTQTADTSDLQNLLQYLAALKGIFFTAQNKRLENDPNTLSNLSQASWNTLVQEAYACFIDIGNAVGTSDKPVIFNLNGDLATNFVKIQFAGDSTSPEQNRIVNQNRSITTAARTIFAPPSMKYLYLRSTDVNDNERSGYKIIQPGHTYVVLDAHCAGGVPTNGDDLLFILANRIKDTGTYSNRSGSSQVGDANAWWTPPTTLSADLRARLQLIRTILQSVQAPFNGTDNDLISALGYVLNTRKQPNQETDSGDGCLSRKDPEDYQNSIKRPSTYFNTINKDGIRTAAGEQGNILFTAWGNY